MLQRLLPSVLAAGALLLGGCGSAAAGTVPAGHLPPPPKVDEATLWAVGDGADGSAQSRLVARLIRRGDPLRFIYLGDVYPTGTWSNYRDSYEPVYGSLKSITLPTPGNHEWPYHRQGYDRYWSPQPGRRGPDYYSLQVAGWKLIGLNSERSLRRSAPQQRWLRRQVAGRSTCRVAFWHRPRYSAGKHGDDRSIRPLWRAVRGRVALVLNAHDHNMQRMRASRGTTGLVVGSGGHERYSLNRAHPRLAWGNASRYGALRLRLGPGRASYAFVAVSGRVLHRGTVRCR